MRSGFGCDCFGVFSPCRSSKGTTFLFTFKGDPQGLRSSLPSSEEEHSSQYPAPGLHQGELT